MRYELKARRWKFKTDEQGNEIGEFEEEKQQDVYLDDLRFSRLKDVYTKRQEHKWDNWMLYCGDEGDGKSTFAKQDCFIMAKLNKGKFDVENIAWEPERFAKLIDASNVGDSILYDEGVTGFNTRRAMSEINNVMISKAVMCRKRRLFIGICIPSIFALQKEIAVRRSMGMVRVYSIQVKRGFYKFYNKKDKRMLYIKGKKFEDMDAHSPSGKPSRFFAWSFVDEKKYEELKDEAHNRLGREKEVFNRYKEQRDALLKGCYYEKGMQQFKISEMMEKYTPFFLDQSSICLITSQEYKNPREKELVMNNAGKPLELPKRLGKVVEDGG